MRYVLTILSILIPAALYAATIDTLTDNFNDNSIDSGKWTTSTTSAYVYESDGQIQMMVLPATNNANANLSTATTYDLTGSSVYVNLVQTANPGTDSVLILDRGSGNRMMWLCSSGTCYAHIQSGGVDQCGGTYCASITGRAGSNFWLRIRESSGTTYWDYSEDNTDTWTNAYNISTASLPYVITAFTFTLQAYEWSTTGATARRYTIWDNFNVAKCDPSTNTCTDYFTDAGYHAWVAPTGVSSANVACWGGGGGGFDGTNSGGGAGGGGGAFASSTVSVSAGTQYTIVSGAGGTEGANGSDSTFATTTVVADAGLGGTDVTTGVGAGGTTAGSTGDVEFAGGTGGTGDGTSDGGGGGGGAGGPHAAGGTGSNATTVIGGDGGQGDPTYGGRAGTGVTTSWAITALGGQSYYGGGGGGGGDNATIGGHAGGVGGGGGGGENNGGVGGTGMCMVVYAGTGGGGGGGFVGDDSSLIWFE